MQRSGGAVILMQKNLDKLEHDIDAVSDDLAYLIGSRETLLGMPSVKSSIPFDDGILGFLDDVAKRLMGRPDIRDFPDVATLGFWIRKAATTKLKERFYKKDGDVRLGRGVVFHIAPSNVPVNYAYSLFTGILTGNANIVRIPSRDFAQVEIINGAIRASLKDHIDMEPYICLVRYGREQRINDMFSSIADTRIIWGGDATISEIRRSPLMPRASEITFADRYSLAVIDSGQYLASKDKDKIALGFYNDTYLMDQNACTSPHIVIWVGDEKERAKKSFWDDIHEIVKKRYTFQPIQGINKLTKSYLLAVAQDGIKIKSHGDNLIIRVDIPKITKDLMDHKCDCGYFFEYDCEDISELKGLCDDKRCQTIAYIGGKEMLLPLVELGVKGIDRVVPVGKTMDFDLIWDGYDLYGQLTRIIKFI